MTPPLPRRGEDRDGGRYCPNYTSFVSRPRSRSGQRDGRLSKMPASTNPGGSLSPDDSVAAMLEVMDHLNPSDTGRFLDHLGKEVPW